MKQVISLFFSIFLASFVAFSQSILSDSLSTSKKSWLIGGGLSLGTNGDIFQGGSTFINFSPTTGYFVTNKFLVGTQISFGLTSNSSSSIKDFSATPFLRYFIGKNKLQPYLQLTGNFEKSIFKDKNSGNKFDFSETGLFGQVGIHYFISKNVAINASLIVRLIGDEQNQIIDNFNTIFNTSTSNSVGIALGINYYLRDKTLQTTSTEISPLVNRYLVPGNKLIGLKGITLFDPFVLLTSFSWKKFKTAKTRQNLIVETFILGDDFDAVFLLRPEVEHFFKINEQFYFSPSIGINLLLSTIDVAELYVNGQLFPKFTYFFNNAFLDMGFQINSPYTQFSDSTDTEWEGSFIIAGEFFIQNNLSLRGELWIDTFGEEHYGNSLLFDALPDVIFRIGINYFLGME